MAVVTYLDTPLDGLLRRAASRGGDRPAVTTAAGTCTYAGLDRTADRVAHTVARAVRRPGGGAVVVCAPHPDVAAVYFGAVRSGRPLALLDPAAGAAAVRELCAAVNAEIAFVPADLAGLFRAAGGRLHTVVVLEPAGTPDAALPALPAGVVAVPWAAAVGEAPATPFRSPVTDAGTVACVQLVPHPATGARVLALTHRNLLANAAQISVACALDAGSVVVDHLPARHPSLLGAAVHAGAEQVLVADPDPCAGMVQCRSRRATHYFGPSARLTRLAEDESFAGHRAPLPGGHLRAVLCADGALKAETARRLRHALRVPVLQGYGVGGLSVLSHVQGPATQPVLGAVGASLPGTECRVVHPVSREPVRAWSGGEVEIRGPQVPSRPAGGWLATGDVGYLDLDDRLHLVARPAAVFRSGDAVVVPGMVERVLRSDPRVADCVVTEWPDAAHGAVVWAGVVLHPTPDGAPDTPAVLDDITARANTLLGPAEQIRHLHALDRVPRTTDGRPARRRLARHTARPAADAA
ncbi:class I adenylate-forming enzyme family protein [Streptomyces sp. NPDC048193]|uniref:class I adenylate-forming enzyme family protein n=1 Tax=unclassified Streptomyces TaxID=2593676 RepID=UPI00342A535B